MTKMTFGGVILMTKMTFFFASLGDNGFYRVMKKISKNLALASQLEKK
jgi:hypothetical protein